MKRGGEMSTMKLQQAATPALIAQARCLFREYRECLNNDNWFPRFKDELDNLPVPYSPPLGRLLIGCVEGKPAGCIAFKVGETEDFCEMKRLYVRPEFRGIKLGRSLAELLIVEAGNAGYKAMRLSMIPAMEEAMGLYKSLGFKEIPPYRVSSCDGTVFMELVF
jgi:putative acetyltransferase